MNKIASISAGMLRTNLRGQIRQTQLPKWKALLPLFEAVMNSFQAIQDADARRAHKITIAVERQEELFEVELPPIVGFEVTDTGVGFDDDNFDSFNTAYSEHKFNRGGTSARRTSAIITVLGWTLLPPLILLALGCAVAWVLSGFRRTA